MVEVWASQKVRAYLKHDRKTKRMEVWIKCESACLPKTRPKFQTIVLQKKMVESNNDRCYNINLKKLCKGIKPASKDHIMYHKLHMKRPQNISIHKTSSLGVIRRS
jgi:hypothetical protein